MPNDFQKHLSVSHVVDYSDGPLIFAANDAVGTRFLCAFLETKETGSEYLCVPTSKGRLNSFLRGVRDLRSMYLESEANEFYKLVTNRADTEPLIATPVLLREIDEALLPREGYFAEAEEEEDELAMKRSVIEASLDVPESRNDTVISSYALAGLVVGVQDGVKFAYRRQIRNRPPADRKLLSDPTYYTVQAYRFSTSSFTVHLRAALTSQDFFDDNLDQAIALVSNVVALSSQPDEAIALLRDNKGHFVSAMKRLIDLPVNQKCALGFGWKSSKDHSVVVRHLMSYDQALHLQQALLKESELQDELIDIEGIFMDGKTSGPEQRWTLRGSDGELFSGEIEPGKNLTLAGVVFHRKYRFRCKEVLAEDASGKKRRKLLLYDYGEISPADPLSPIALEPLALPTPDAEPE